MGTGMAGPFPGMDPWLEHPELWPDVHNSLIAALATRLSGILRPDCFVRIEERTYLAESEGLLVGRPALSIRGVGRCEQPATPASGHAARVITVEVPVPDILHETWLEVRAVANAEVVTVIEVLSPSNKVRGSEGRALYEKKRREILGSRTSLVEIDLVRAGTPKPLHGAAEESDYRLLVSRGDRRPRAELVPFSVRDPIPAFPLPLRPGEPEPVVELGDVLAELHEARSYRLMIDYARDPSPPLRAEDTAWARTILQDAGFVPRSA